MSSKKGQVSFGSAPSLVLTLVITTLILAAGAIAIVGMRINSAAYTDQATSTSPLNNTVANGLTATTNFSGQIGTVGTMLGVALVLIVILGAFGFGRSKGGL